MTEFNTRVVISKNESLRMEPYRLLRYMNMHQIGMAKTSTQLYSCHGISGRGKGSRIMYAT
jgi:hypothetical protein